MQIYRNKLECTKGILVVQPQNKTQERLIGMAKVTCCRTHHECTRLEIHNWNPKSWHLGWIKLQCCLFVFLLASMRVFKKPFRAQINKPVLARYNIPLQY